MIYSGLRTYLNNALIKFMEHPDSKDSFQHSCVVLYSYDSVMNKNNYFKELKTLILIPMYYLNHINETR